MVERYFNQDRLSLSRCPIGDSYDDGAICGLVSSTQSVGAKSFHGLGVCSFGRLRGSERTAALHQG